MLSQTAADGVLWELSLQCIWRGGGGLWGAETSGILLKEEIVEVMRLGGNRLCWCRVLERGQ